MKNLLSTNVYDIENKIVIMGSCLPNMQPNAYKELLSISSNIYELCLEKDHINMAVAKLAGMVARKNIEQIIFASIDKSPHCTQLHYIAKEVIKITGKTNLKIKHFVAVNDNLIEISLDAVDFSKNLYELNKLTKK